MKQTLQKVFIAIGSSLISFGYRLNKEVSISKILNKYDSDKNRGVTRRSYGHSYGAFYDNLFSKFDRGNPINILELGVEKGGSLLAWKEYFPHANVYGVDIQDIRPQKYISNTVTFYKMDLRDAVEKFKDMKFDIIIDDSDHAWETLCFVVPNYFKLLKPVGAMVLEDIMIPNKYIEEIKKVMPANTKMTTHDFRKLRNRHDDFIIALTTPECAYLVE